jgi:hypothetical protein
VLPAAGVLSYLCQQLEETFKWRSSAGVAEAYKELTMPLEKFKTDMEGTTSGSATNTSLWRM